MAGARSCSKHSKVDTQMKSIKSPALVAIATLATLIATGCDQSDDSTVEDRSARIDVVFEGVRYDAEEMDAFNGDGLHYYVDGSSEAEGIMYAFASPEERDAFLVEREPIVAAYEAEQLQFRAPLTNSKFYDYVDYGGLFGELKKGESIANLDFHPDYDDNDISSVKCRVNAYTWLWDDTGFGGGSLYCRAINLPNLTIYGWNQRASSLEVTP